MKRKLTTLVIAVLLLAAGAANAQTGTFNISTGSWTGSGDYCTWNDPVLIVNDGANVTITGTASGGRRVEVNGNASITLQDLTISHPGGSVMTINGGADVTISLVGTNSLTQSNVQGAGIETAGNAQLTIGGTGTLYAKGGYGGAGIGGSPDATITITGGDITVHGSTGCAGIGGSRNNAGGNIIITGGIINAQGGIYGAGIGGGEGGAGGTIAITGGTITTKGGQFGAGIGGGQSSAGGDITISAGNITATGGVFGAGIGGGGREYGGGGDGGVITITGGTIIADNGSFGTPEAADIGHGASDSGPGLDAVVTITGGSVNATKKLVDSPKDANGPVYMVRLTVGNPPVGGNEALMVNVNGLSYDVTDVKIDANGRVYFWLPAGDMHLVGDISGAYCEVTYNQAANNNNIATLMILSVTVTPATVNVQKGSTQAFSASATVEGVAGVAQTVTWTVTDEAGGAVSGGTTISSTGELTVAANEPLSVLHVVATSTIDGQTSGRAVASLYMKSPLPGWDTEVTTPPGGDPVPDEDGGGMTLPDGGEFTDPEDGSEYDLPPGTHVDEDGNITTGDDGGTIITDEGSEIDLPGDTQITPDGDGEGHTVVEPGDGGATVTYPDGSEVEVPGDGSIIIIDPSAPGGLRIECPVRFVLAPGVRVDPAREVNYVPMGRNFDFTLTPPSRDLAFTVTTSRIVNGAPEKLLGHLNVDGTYTYTVREVRQAVVVSVSTYLNVGNEKISSGHRVWTEGNRLFVDAAKPTTVSIYTVTGKLYGVRKVPAGQTSFALGAPGVYVVEIDGATIQLRIRN